jgi:hypothetical protein
MTISYRIDTHQDSSAVRGITLLDFLRECAPLSKLY